MIDFDCTSFSIDCDWSWLIDALHCEWQVSWTSCEDIEQKQIYQEIDREGVDDCSSPYYEVSLLYIYTVVVVYIMRL
jgi:hypothetical protein